VCDWSEVLAVCKVGLQSSAKNVRVWCVQHFLVAGSWQLAAGKNEMVDENVVIASEDRLILWRGAA